eukprot:scaffold7381_cov310-Pinguiococcus_pyrenoidosus.AAC.9
MQPHLIRIANRWPRPSESIGCIGFTATDRWSTIGCCSVACNTAAQVERQPRKPPSHWSIPEFGQQSGAERCSSNQNNIPAFQKHPYRKMNMRIDRLHNIRIEMSGTANNENKTKQPSICPGICAALFASVVEIRVATSVRQDPRSSLRGATEPEPAPDLPVRLVHATMKLASYALLSTLALVGTVGYAFYTRCVGEGLSLSPAVPRACFASFLVPIRSYAWPKRAQLPSNPVLSGGGLPRHVEVVRPRSGQLRAHDDLHAGEAGEVRLPGEAARARSGSAHGEQPLRHHGDLPGAHDLPEGAQHEGDRPVHGPPLHEDLPLAFEKSRGACRADRAELLHAVSPRAPAVQPHHRGPRGPRALHDGLHGLWAVGDPALRLRVRHSSPVGGLREREVLPPQDHRAL